MCLTRVFLAFSVSLIDYQYFPFPHGISPHVCFIFSPFLLRLLADRLRAHVVGAALDEQDAGWIEEKDQMLRMISLYHTSLFQFSVHFSN